MRCPLLRSGRRPQAALALAVPVCLGGAVGHGAPRGGGDPIVCRCGEGVQPERELRPSATLGAFPFTRVRGLAELPDGTLIVADQTENAVWRVDLGAGTRTRVGPEGEGPGEFDGPTGVMGFRGDSVVVTDLGNGRLSVIGPDLSFGRTMPMFLPTGGIPSMGDADGGLYHDLISRTRGEKRTDPDAEWAPLVRWDGASERADTVGRLRVPGPPRPSPFPAWDVWAAGRDGRVAIVRNQDAYRVDWVLPDGRRIEGSVVAEERPRLRSEDRAAWMERNPAGMASVTMSGAAPRRVEPEFPDRFPFARQQGTFIDGEGRLWVERQQSLREDRPRYDVWAPERGRVAVIRLPAGRQVVGSGRQAVYAVRVDDLGLQWLERYAIPDVGGGAAR